MSFDVIHVLEPIRMSLFAKLLIACSSLLSATEVFACDPHGTQNGVAEHEPRHTPQGELRRYEFVRRQMGVPFKIALYAGQEAIAIPAADAAFHRIARLNKVYSDYDPDSELMRLCRLSKPGKPIAVSKDLFHVLSKSWALSRQTDGAFDVTVGPVVKLWRRARRQKKLPAADKLDSALTKVGWQYLRLDEQSQEVELLRAGMRLDLGGIAKGHAADEAPAVLRQRGIARALIDGGGDIVAGDAPPGKSGWRIGIAPHDEPEGNPSRHVLIANAAVATSGDAFQYVEIDGVRYSHLVNPKTGLGLTTRSSVTVVARNGLAADSLASAVSVLGAEPGLRLLESTPGADGLIIKQADAVPREFCSSGWRSQEIRE